MEASEGVNRAPAVSVETVGQRIGRYRWVICALLFFATTVNYVDRQVLGILSKDLKEAIHWTDVDYGNIVAAFSAAYAFGLLLAGRLSSLSIYCDLVHVSTPRVLLIDAACQETAVHRDDLAGDETRRV